MVFSHADPLTGCLLDANNIIKFRAYRRLLLSAAYVTRNLGVDEHGLFVVDEDFFIVCTRHAQIVFTRSSSVARALVSTPTCCNILQYIKRTKPSADRWAIDPWVRVVPSFLCASLFQSVCARVGNDVFLAATWNLFVIFTRYRMPLLGAFSCRPSVSLGTICCTHAVIDIVAVTHRILL